MRLIRGRAHGEGEPGTPTEALPLRTVIDSLPRAVVVTDPSSRVALWNLQAERLYGWTEDEAVGRSIVELLPLVEAADGADARTTDMTVAAEPSHQERSVRHRDGHVVEVISFTRPIRDDGGAIRWLLDASEDLSRLRAVEADRERLAERLRLALEAAELGTWNWELASNTVSWDARMEELYGLPAGSFDGTFEGAFEAVLAEDRADVLAVAQRAVEDRSAYRLEHRVQFADGTIRWLQDSGQAVVDDRDEVIRVIGCSMDITEQVQQREAAEEAACTARALAAQEAVNRERFEFLAAVNDAVADARSVDEVVHRFVRAAVPRLGDWCSVHLVDGPGDADPQIVTYHVDPDLVAWIESLNDRFPYDPDAPNGIAHVIRTGETEFYPEITSNIIDDVLVEAGYDSEATDELRGVLDRLRLRSTITVPLIKLGRILGGITFATTSDGRHYTTEDLDLARAVAGRVAASIENRRLSDHQRQIAQTLQASLLPAELPVIPRLDVAVRYWAAGEGIEVGGDFYDVFPVGHDRWTAVIGDVCGKGPEAASLTGLARHTLRDAAWHGDEPAEVCRRINDAMRAVSTTSFLTAAIVDIHTSAVGFELVITLAGHPQPILVTADNRAQPVGTPGQLLGCLSDVTTTPTHVPLGPGDTLVLYTDGISDLPPPDLLTSADVSQLIARAVIGSRTSEEVCDRVERALAEQVDLKDRPDDIAVIAVRAPLT